MKKTAAQLDTHARTEKRFLLTSSPDRVLSSTL